MRFDVWFVSAQRKEEELCKRTLIQEWKRKGKSFGDRRDYFEWRTRLELDFGEPESEND
jgi:hypothetical protein